MPEPELLTAPPVELVALAGADTVPLFVLLAPGPVAVSDTEKVPAVE